MENNYCDETFLDDCSITFGCSRCLTEPYHKYLTNNNNVLLSSASNAVASYQNPLLKEILFNELFDDTERSLPYYDLPAFINEDKYENIEYFKDYLSSQEKPRNVVDKLHKNSSAYLAINDNIDNLSNTKIKNNHLKDHTYVRSNDRDKNCRIKMMSTSIIKKQKRILQMQQSQRQQNIELKSSATLKTNSNVENVNTTDDNNICINQIFVEDFNKTDVLVPETNESSSNHLAAIDTNIVINNNAEKDYNFNLKDYNKITCSPLKKKFDNKLQDIVVKTKKMKINDNTNNSQENNENAIDN